MSAKRLHLNLFVHSRGHHEASWRHPKASPHSVFDLAYYQELAQKAEAGLFDSMFFADQLALGDDIGNGPRIGLEPITLLSALAANTMHIGLIATASTTYTEPFNLARQFASLDHISKGRIGWNIVTSWLATAAANFNREAPLAHAERYARAEEFVAVVKALWDSWASDAIIDERAGGRYAKTDRIRPVEFAGQYYQVRGPLNLPRSVQGRPVLVQAGSSETGRAFAARHGEAIFTAQLEKQAAQDFYSDIKSRAAQAGRAADQVLILPGLSPLLAGTEAEAQRISDELAELADPEVGRKRLSARFGGHDLSHLPLDKTLSPEDFPSPETVEAARSRSQVIIDLVRRHEPTLRELLAMLAGARGHHTFVGTPDQLADLMTDWVNEGAADGFNIMPPVLPWMLDVFVDEVVPILQRRDLFREAYEGRTLRSHYGLREPASQFDEA
jgi:FMN-dependent oxidoreductase (nitrilotriacetate monooxygenase family)